MMFPHSITVFNIVSDEVDEPVYLSTVVNNVLFLKDENTTRNKVGIANADTVRVYIPYDKMKSDKTLVGEFQFAQLVDKSEFFTFRKGDYVSFGVVDIGESDINDFKNKYGNIYEIQGIADYPLGGLPHIDISAK